MLVPQKNQKFLEVFKINTKFEVLENTSFEIICFDFENNQNIKLEYFLELIDDLKPFYDYCIKIPESENILKKMKELDEKYEKESKEEKEKINKKQNKKKKVKGAKE